MNRLLLALVLTAATTATARAAESLYEITKVEPKVAVGGTGTASLTIKVKGGWHVNDEAPISVALTPPPGLSVKKAKLTRADLAASSKESARFDIPVSATAVGTQTLGAEAHFVLCQEQACKPVKETVTLAIEVTPAATGKKKKH
ncbi:MAG TPA: hypothetical protein VHO06_15905 [Polyangia bacterium]|nr:hypothetical protein [Polyangia bacterium]